MPLKLSFSILVISSIIFISCSSSSFVDLESLKGDLKIKDFPEQKDYPEADAVILSESHNVNLNINENWKLETTEKTSRVEKLFKNIDENASVEFYVPNWEKLLDIHARVIEPDGKIIVLKADDFHTISGNDEGYIFFSDDKKIKFTFPSIEKNSIIEYNYTLYKELPFVTDVWQIQSNLPEMQNNYTLTLPILLLTPEGGNWNWRYITENCNVEKPVFQKDNDDNKGIRTREVSYTWGQTNIPAFEPDPMMPPIENFLKYVRFAPSDWKKWDDISDWYYNQYFKPQFIITDDIKNKAAVLTKYSTNEIEKIRSIFNFVQGIRYVAIVLGRGGWAPDPPQKVLDNKYGDCKDKSILMLSMLKSLGIKAKPVLVLTADDGMVDPIFPCWHFNHMIVKATTNEGIDFWIDPTVDHFKLGEIPSADEGINALVLNDDGTSQIEVTPSSYAYQNVKDVNINVKFTDSTDALFDISIKYQGEYNGFYRSYFNEMTDKDMMKYCKTLVADDFLNAEVISYTLSNLDSVDANLVLDFKLKVPNSVEKQGDLVFFNPDPFKIINNWKWLAKDKRNYDMDFDFPYTIKKTINIELPSGAYSVRNLPKNSILSEGDLLYGKDYNLVDENHIVSKEQFSVRSKIIIVKDYDKVRSFFDKMKSKLSDKIILQEK